MYDTYLLTYDAENLHTVYLRRFVPIIGHNSLLNLARLCLGWKCLVCGEVSCGEQLLLRRRKKRSTAVY